MIPRRTFLRTSAGAAGLAALGDLAFLRGLPAVSAEAASVAPPRVRFDSETEPLVRLIEETPRERLLEEVAQRLKRGLSYRGVLTALMLAGVRNIQPRPVGFKFHAVLVVNSAHLASLASPESDRWLPIFWALDEFKSSQAANVKEGNWTMPPVDEAAVPASHLARAAFLRAMDEWDESAADAAVVALVRSTGADELFEIFARYGARDFRDIGHKAIYVANSFRCLEVIGWQHAEPVLRSLAFALLDRSGAKENPAHADLAADRPFRENLTALKDLRPDWLEGKPSAAATAEFLQAIRGGASASDAAQLTAKMINAGVAPSSISDALYTGAGELMMQAPGIIAVHAMTFANAVHYAFRRVQSDETRRLLLLQNAAFLPLYRGAHHDTGVHPEALDPLHPDAAGDEALPEIFAEAAHDRLAAARKLLGYLQTAPNPGAFAVSARRMIFLKGRNAHDYKFSTAVLEDYPRLSAPWRDRVLASSLFYFRSAGDPDNGLVQRTRAALA